MFAANHKENVRRLRKDVRDAAQDAQNDLTSMARVVGEQVRDFVETAVSSASDGLSTARETLSDATGTVSKRIHKKPLESAAIALGIGIILGAFLRRR